MKNKIQLILVLAMFVIQHTLYAAMQQVPPIPSSDRGVDIFERFALQENVHVPGLESNRAPELPILVLPMDSVLGKGFTPLRKITTQKQLDTELKRMRKKYEPFMADRSPSLPLTRHRVYLDTFEWRLVSSEMEPVNIEQDWQEVTIPHYTGPINKAEASYRKKLMIAESQLKADKLFLHFNAADYSVEVFINQKKVGKHTGLFGAFEFDVKPWVHIGENLLEVRIFNDVVMMGDNFFLGPDRKFGQKIAACGGPGWDEPGLAKGWHMSAPGFGIWQQCYLETRSDVFINSLFVNPLLEENMAEVWVELPENLHDIELSYSLYGQNFKRTITENNIYDLLDAVPAPASPGFNLYKIHVAIPDEQLKLWSPDEPWLYQVQVEVKHKGKLLDAAKRQFGMRSFVQSEESIPKGRFYLNGKEIKLRGANMMGNLMQSVIRRDYNQLRDDILLAKIANMNFWRMTQQPCQEEVYDYFDRIGMMAQTDFPTFNGIRKDVVETAKTQFVEMMKLVRGHPSNIIISYLNEPDFTKPMMLDREGHRMLFTSFDTVAEILNPGQVTKWVDGDYVNLSPRYSDHHNYNVWYGSGIKSEYFGNWIDTRAGWMHACGEFGAEGLDHVSTMKKYYPEEWLATGSDGVWSPEAIPRCQTPTIGMKWQNLTDKGIEDWVYSSQHHQMWATRLFTESLRRDNKMNSFAIHLLIDAWPASWLKSIVSYDRVAKPAYFAYRDALTPLAVNLRPAAFYGFSGEMNEIGVWICNDIPEKIQDATLRYQVEFEGKIIQTGNTKVSILASNSEFKGWVQVVLPEVAQRNKITVRVALFSDEGKAFHEGTVELDVFPGADKGKALDFPGGQAQRLIAN
ncbi:glycoside hydrolase family 2 protein [Sphingobacterium lumbrici]|uniref:glycoside hydrolase family 2 protein n=1 Tax=Sphingobacterium lumbrici TaxID=2559600 RepID=UPI00112EA74D|nr:sugar-binding domain-containing protein [Sphingobacterium lumbrici]